MNRSTTFKACLLAASLAAPSVPQTFAQTPAPAPSVTLGDQPLILQGTGVRRKFFIDVYSLALYTERRFKDGESLVAATGPRRAELRFLRDVDRARGEAAWREAIEHAVDADERQRLAADIARFAALFPAVKKGDTITLDDIPGRGLTLQLNGGTLGTIENPALFRTVLKIWVGPNPIQTSLKKDLLR